MKKEMALWFGSKYLNKPVLIVMVSLTLVSSFYFASPSFSKYVLDTVIYNVKYHSAEIYQIQSIGTIMGNMEVGQTLLVGTLDPEDATVGYQWQRCTTSGGVYMNISGANSSIYTLSSDDYGYYIRVIATGTGKYLGKVTSAQTGPVAKAPLTAISDIIGTTSVGQTLTAGTVTPIGATVTYQWQRSSNGTTYANISGATASTYTLAGSDINYYIRVLATGTGAYTGTITSAPTTDPVLNGSTIPITAIGTISGTCQVEQTLTVGELAPFSASATYQWQRCDTENGNFTSIPGATSNTYKLKSSDYGYYLRVIATGSGNNSGTVISSAKGPVTYAHITDIGAINGTTKVGQVLTAGVMTPSNATAAYQWQRSSNAYGAYTDISGATSRTYKLTTADSGCFIKVSATGTGYYVGTVTSEKVGLIVDQATPVTPIESIEAIGGAVQVGSALTAGTLAPSDATATYQWQRSTTAGGIYMNISGANSNSYTLSADDYNYFIRLKATGSGSYTGIVTSAIAGPVAACPITAIGAISGSTVPGQELTAGTVTPLGATVSYQWQRSDTGDGTSYTNIAGAMSSTYTVPGSDNYRYIRVIVTGTGSYTGTITSVPTTSRVSYTSTSITAISTISGTAQVGNTLTAGTLAPTGATATYQWKKCTTSDGVYENIPGATSNTYTLKSSDYGYYIRVTASGSGSYTGTITSAASGPAATALITAIDAISGTATSGHTLTAGTVNPLGATVSYQWQRASTAYGTYTDISGATFSTYSLGEGDIGNYLKVKVTGTGGYTGTATSMYTGPVFGGSATLLTAIAQISGTAQVEQMLAAGEVSPSGATVTYQWQRCSAAGGVYMNISGATSNTYTLSADDYNYYIRLKATGSGSCAGTVISAVAGPVAACPITAIGAIIGSTVPDQQLIAGTITPLGATVSYQWQRSDTGSGTSYSNISGATSNIYTVNSSESYRYIRVIVTGIGSYTGTITSAPTVSRVGNSSTPITAISVNSGMARVGNTLTAGTLAPSGATATYQWKKCTTSDGAYENIPGATSNAYTLKSSDYGYYIRVTASGSGSYTGTITSAASGPVATALITAVDAITGTAASGQTLTAGTVTPLGATVSYQWQRASTAYGTYTDISGATFSTYSLGEGDIGNYLKVKVTGTGGYTGTAASMYTGPVFGGSATLLTAITAISGTAQVEKTLTVGDVSPSGATATYQWQRCTTADGVYMNISGATSDAYTISSDDYNYYIRVRVTGSGSYAGTVISSVAGPVAACPITAIGAISGSTVPDQTLTAGTITPLGATVSFQWQKSDTGSGTSFSNISGATASTYTVNSSESYRYIRVIVTGTGSYIGTVTSAPTTSRVSYSSTPITAISVISGTAQVGNTLTVGTLVPTGATATYQWKKCTTSDGVYENITGATSSTYTLKASDYGYYICVETTGSGSYTGTVISAASGPVSMIPITTIGAISGTAASGQTLIAGNIAPLGATVSYQWQRCNTADGIYEDIPGAVSSSYIPVTNDIGYYIKVKVTGTGNYSGTVDSAYVGPIVETLTVVTEIVDITEMDQTVEMPTETDQTGEASTKEEPAPSETTPTVETTDPKGETETETSENTNQMEPLPTDISETMVPLSIL